MKKQIILAAAAVLMSGCANSGGTQGIVDTELSNSISSNTSNSSDVYDEKTASDIMIIKWGVGGYSRAEDAGISKLNKQLTEEGSKLRVELVTLDMGMDESITFSKLVEDYEKKHGSFDIVTYGSDWVSKKGAVNIFIESGYFRELSAEEMEFFTDVPDICWDAATVKGKHYTVPGLNFGFGDSIGMFFHFNTEYISEDKLQSFGSTIAELEDILDGIVPNENLTVLEYQTDYLDFTDYTPASEMGRLYLSDKTMKAMNPYESDEVIEYARTLNRLYQKGYMNYGIDFSNWNGDSESLYTKFAISVCGGKMYEEELEKRLGNGYNEIEYSLPYYMENRLSDSTGIPVNSAHPDEAMELLKRLHTDRKLSGLLTERERSSIGLPRDNMPVDASKVKLSPFAGFQLKYTDIDEFKTVSELCKSSFDKLCKAEDFDKTLAEIKAELKKAGIDDYVALVNQRLEESNAASNQ